tara:strand:+ start:95070 stop:95945 length:876 start_codon:yes stop_codon:yes gene_type:complete
MRRIALALLLSTSAAAPALAQHMDGHHAPDPHAGHDMPETPATQEDEQPGAQSAADPARHAADAIWGADAMRASRQRLAHENGGMTTSTMMLERLEARFGEQDLYLWDAQGWTGGDLDKLWIKTEGEGAFDNGVEDAEIQALWSHAIGPWFDLQSGVRYDIEPDSRAHLVLGLQGLAPYMFEVDAAAFLSDQGDFTARIEAEYDQRITQRLILQPRVELDVSAQTIERRSIGAGPARLTAGLRLRYEFAREFAPYVGVEWERHLGGTADSVRDAGESASSGYVLLGLRTWF